MRDIDDLITEVNDAIQEVADAKRELELRTNDIVRHMKEEGRTREWAVGYFDLVCKSVDARTAEWSRHFFEKAWPEETEQQ